ncbi:MAG: hypothetical protein WA908_11145 [Pontixanthobacter sp.]
MRFSIHSNIGQTVLGGLAATALLTSAAALAQPVNDSDDAARATFAPEASAQASADAVNDLPAPPTGSVGGMGDINLFPKRVVIEGRRQVSTIGLYNKTIDPGDYEISVVDMAMRSDGQLLAFDNGATEAEQAQVATASPFLRYSPRRVTLDGSESQIIRVMARGGSDLPPGEYRSHFMVVSVPRDQQEGFSIDDAVEGQQAEGIGVSIRPRFGISIPIIVRVGDTTLDVGIRDAKLMTAQDGSQAVAIIMTRTGTRSAFGDIVITANGADDPVALTKGVGIYPELDERMVVVPIDPETPPEFLSAGRTLSITYTDDDFAPGSKLAGFSFVIP